MAKPTTAQVRALEIAHKEQYIRLVASNRLWIQLFTKLYNSKLPKTDKKWTALYDFGRLIAKQAGSWYVRQKSFESKAGVPAVRADIVKYFLIPKEEKKLITVANSYLDPNKETIKGIGIIPLIVWGVVALVVAFTAIQITDELNTTAEEKQELMVQTQKTLKELNVTGTEAANIITNTQAEASANETSSGLFDGVFPKLALIGVAAYFFMNKSKAN